MLGRVSLVCPDTSDRRGLVKGYEYDFDVLIRDVVIQGQYGAPGHPASVSCMGQVGDDGTLEISATAIPGVQNIRSARSRKARTTAKRCKASLWVPVARQPARGSALQCHLHEVMKQRADAEDGRAQPRRDKREIARKFP